MAILYVAAEAMELAPFASRLEGVRKMNWPVDYAMEGVLDGRRVMLAANGAGPRLAAQAVEVAVRAVLVAELSASRLEAVVSTGFCGGLEPSLRAGQIVVADAVVSSGGERRACTLPDAAPEGFATGAVWSEDRIMTTVGDKARLHEQGAIACDMESAGVLTRTQRAGLPFYCIKAVSDAASEPLPFDLNRMRTSEGRIARGKIISYSLTHPLTLSGLFGLKRRAEMAARELGDFLASCRIIGPAGSAPVE